MDIDNTYIKRLKNTLSTISSKAAAHEDMNKTTSIE